MKFEKSLSVFSNFINFLQISVTKKILLIRNQLAFIIDLQYLWKLLNFMNIKFSSYSDNLSKNSFEFHSFLKTL